MLEEAREWVSEKAAYLAETPKRVAEKREHISEKVAENKLQTLVVCEEYDRAEKVAAKLGRPDRYVREKARESAENCIDIRYWKLADAHIRYGGFGDLRERMEEEAYRAVTDRLREDAPTYSDAATEAVQLHREYDLLDCGRVRGEARSARDRALREGRIGDGIDLTQHFNLHPAPVNHVIDEDDDHDPVRTTAEEEVARQALEGLLDDEGNLALSGPRYVFVDEDALAEAFRGEMGDTGHDPEQLAADTAAYLRETLSLGSRT